MSNRPSLVLTASAVVYLAGALALLFAPQEALAAAGVPVARAAVALAQSLGSALFGFSMLNWLQRHARIGGIFGRPVVVANLAHAASAALLLARIATTPPYSLVLWAALALYAVIGVAFAVKLLVSPATPPDETR